MHTYTHTLTYSCIYTHIHTHNTYEFMKIGVYACIMYVCIHVCMQACHPCFHVCKCVRTQVCMYVCMCMCVIQFACMYVWVHACMCARMFVFKFQMPYTYVNRRACIHTTCQWFTDVKVCVFSVKNRQSRGKNKKNHQRAIGSWIMAHQAFFLGRMSSMCSVCTYVSVHTWHTVLYICECVSLSLSVYAHRERDTLTPIERETHLLRVRETHRVCLVQGGEDS